MVMQFTPEALKTLKSGYLREGEETPFDMFDRVINQSVKILKSYKCFTKVFIRAYKKDLRTIFYNGYLGGATPVLSNFGSNTKAMPISCFVVNAQNSIKSIYGHHPEVAVMSQLGGGVGVKINAQAEGTPTSNGGLASGPVSFYRGYDEIAETVSQGGVRRGAMAFFMDATHPDVEKFIKTRDHSVGDPRGHIHSNIGIDLPDSFMEKVGTDPKVTDLWFKILESRIETGTPYLHFIDNHNRVRAEPLKILEMLITGTNICTEISSAATDFLSMVCCLSSLNLELWDVWKDFASQSETGCSVPFLSIIFLDTVMEEFIRKSKKIRELKRARDYAIKGRPLGLGVLGWHGLLLQESIPFDSRESFKLNKQIFSYIHREAINATEWMGARVGCSEWGSVTKWRNIQTTAVAPTVSNSTILGAVSAGVAPIPSIAYLTKGAKGIFKRGNKYFEELLEKKYGLSKLEISQVIGQVIEDNGSVQNLSFLEKHDKEVYKTAREIDQMSIISQAAERQQYLTQTQSINVFMDSTTDPQIIHDVHYQAWKLGLPTLYYNYSDSISKKTVKSLQEEESYFVISMQGCPYCEKAKNLLLENDLLFSIVDKEDIDPTEFETPDGWKTYPRVYSKKKEKYTFIGGFNELRNKLNGMEPTDRNANAPDEPNPLDCASCGG